MYWDVLFDVLVKASLSYLYDPSHRKRNNRYYFARKSQVCRSRGRKTIAKMFEDIMRDSVSSKTNFAIILKGRELARQRFFARHNST